jgi:hypothetical protein
MIGIDSERARSVYGLPANVEALTALAIGYRESPDALPEVLRDRDTTPRTRRPMTEWVYEGDWARPPSWVE